MTTKFLTINFALSKCYCHIGNGHTCTFSPFLCKVKRERSENVFGEVWFLLALDGPSRTVAMLSVCQCPLCPELCSYYVPAFFCANGRVTNRRVPPFIVIAFPKKNCVFFWKATKEYLNQRGTKIRVFRVFFRAPFLPPFLPYFSPLFPLQALFALPPLLPSSPPPFSKFSLTPGKLRFRHPLI